MATDEREPKRYEIWTIADFLKVPPDRLDDCLSDFRSYLEVKQPLVDYFEIVKAVAKAEGEILDGLSDSPFIWIDDGRPTDRVTVEFTDTDDGGMKVEIRTEPDDPL